MIEKETRCYWRACHELARATKEARAAVVADAVADIEAIAHHTTRANLRAAAARKALAAASSRYAPTRRAARACVAALIKRQLVAANDDARYPTPAIVISLALALRARAGHPPGAARSARDRRRTLAAEISGPPEL